MIKPKVHKIKNIAVLIFTTHFGELETYCLRKEPHQTFHLCYTGIDKITKYQGQVKAIWKDYLEVYLPGGNTIRTCYGVKQDIQPGQLVYVYEFFKVDKDMEYNWVASVKEIEDARMIYINLDIMENDKIIERLKIDPYFGRSVIISFSKKKE